MAIKYYQTFLMSMLLLCSSCDGCKSKETNKNSGPQESTRQIDEAKKDELAGGRKKSKPSVPEPQPKIRPNHHNPQPRTTEKSSILEPQSNIRPTHHNPQPRTTEKRSVLEPQSKIGSTHHNPQSRTTEKPSVLEPQFKIGPAHPNTHPSTTPKPDLPQLQPKIGTPTNMPLANPNHVLGLAQNTQPIWPQLDSNTLPKLVLDQPEKEFEDPTSLVSNSAITSPSLDAIDLPQLALIPPVSEGEKQQHIAVIGDEIIAKTAVKGSGHKPFKNSNCDILADSLRSVIKDPKELLANGINREAKGGYEITPLVRKEENQQPVLAITDKTIERVQAEAKNPWLGLDLLDNKLLELNSEGAEVYADVQDEFGMTALHKAIVFFRDLENAQTLLIQGANIEVRDNNGFTPLHQAAYHGEEKLAKLLLENKANIEARDNNGFTPLHQAAYRGKREIVALFLEQEVDKEAKDRNGRTPIHQAVEEDHPEIVELLIQEGADVNVKNKDGYAPLHRAVQNGKKEIAESLIQAMADIDAQDKKGRTPLHLAICDNSKEIAEMLLDAGASKAIKDVNDQTPYQIAQAYKLSPEFLKLLS